MSEPERRWFQSAGLRFHYLEWSGTGPAIVLLHGLASNAWIWGEVGSRLAGRCRVWALDQRGHGRSGKPDQGYDFTTISADLAAFLDHLGLAGPDRPLLVGHSWGGNVTLAFAAADPERARGLVWVDGGFLNLRDRPGATWESTERDLAPPPTAGLTRVELLEMARAGEYGEIWAPHVERSLLGCFVIDEEDRVYPNLALANHLQILRALWDQNPPELYPRVSCPVLILPARRATLDGLNEFQAMKERAVGAAERLLPRSEVRWFEDTIHDVPLHRAAALADAIAGFAATLSAENGAPGRG